MSNPLSAMELERYSRQISLADIGVDGQSRIKHSSVLVVGAGGLGSPAIIYLASCGVGKIGIVDGDLIEQSNLHRQILFNETEIGKSKAQIAAVKAAAINPAAKINAYAVKLDTSNVRELCSQYDVVLDCSDNFEARYIINDACIQIAKPFVSASISEFSAQLSVFNLPPDGPTYRCLYPEPPSPEDAPACSTAGVLGSLPGIVGAMQAHECLKLILGRKETLSGKLLIVDSSAMTFKTATVHRTDVGVKDSFIRTAEYYHSFCALRPTTRLEVTTSDFEADRQAGKQMFLLDVREPHERAQFHIGGEHVPLAHFPGYIDKLPRDRDVIIYCKSGMRSLHACEAARKLAGLTNVYSLKGGLEEYKRYTASQPGKPL